MKGFISVSFVLHHNGVFRSTVNIKMSRQGFSVIWKVVLESQKVEKPWFKRRCQNQLRDRNHIDEIYNLTAPRVADQPFWTRILMYKSACCAGASLICTQFDSWAGSHYISARALQSCEQLRLINEAAVMYLTQLWNPWPYFFASWREIDCRGKQENRFFSENVALLFCILLKTIRFFFMCVCNVCVCMCVRLHW